jgi:hypothetical protein
VGQAIGLDRKSEAASQKDTRDLEELMYLELRVSMKDPVAYDILELVPSYWHDCDRNVNVLFFLIISIEYQSYKYRIHRWGPLGVALTVNSN